MKKLMLVALSAAASLLIATSAMADNTKIGVLDFQQVMQKSKQVQAINTQLRSQFQPRWDKITAAEKSLQSESDQLTKNSATMSDADRSKLQDQVTTDKSNVQVQIQNFQRDLTAAQNQAMQKFMAQVSTIVANVAKQGNYDVILLKNNVPYANTNLDVTSQVLTQLDQAPASS